MRRRLQHFRLHIECKPIFGQPSSIFTELQKKHKNIGCFLATVTINEEWKAAVNQGVRSTRRVCRNHQWSTIRHAIITVICLHSTHHPSIVLLPLNSSLIGGYHPCAFMICLCDWLKNTNFVPNLAIKPPLPSKRNSLSLLTNAKFSISFSRVCSLFICPRDI